MTPEGTLVDIDRINWEAIWRLLSMLSLYDDQNCSDRLIYETEQWMERYRGTHEQTIAITLAVARELVLEDINSYLERKHDAELVKRNIELLGGRSLIPHENDQEKQKKCVEKNT